MRRHGVIIGIALAFLLTGCATTGGSAPTVVVSASPTVAPSPTGETTAPTISPSPTTTAAAGCPANDVPVPADAALATIQDVDGDGRGDAEFYSEEDGFYYGIRTASGATVLLKDDLAGPNTHSGWTSIREGATVTVLDDGRTATLHAFIDCAFVTTTDSGGTPYRFGLNGFSDYGTGVQCTDQNGGSLLYGVLASRQADGTYDITRTQIILTDGGRIARNSSQVGSVAQGLPGDDERVALAMRSTCGQTPIVKTSGR
ncbi:hypothetical protein [Cryobacterium sp. PH29-G1]|uniref:hypothetical protein n=1 Tax=Cryobacterium sp. PH29-G1 TaxID=3046211 RepID=UPI0024BA0410|nr:hypothetical protein [Cryobacterium sp. PH29-G1]MDJ0349940.1 hypothetical protein [Cryobacterium sp. PH29-G1]